VIKPIKEAVMKRTVILTVSLLALAALAVAAPAVQAKGGPGQRIALKSSGAFPGASGKAKFQNEGQRELEIEVEHVRRLAGKRVSFFVNSTKVGSARVNGLGAAQVNRRGASFPAINAGTRIKVKTTAGKLIVSGRF
jgi:opacity protein-like surface antigen